MSKRKFLIKVLSKPFIFYFKIKYKIFGIHVINNILQKENFYNISLLRAFGATIGEGTVIKTLFIQNAEKDYSNLIIGKKCHLGKGVFLDLADKIIIEDNVTISMFTKIITHIHLGESNLKNFFNKKYKTVILRKDVYIGANTVILMGVIIEKNNFIGANSLVTKNIEGEFGVYIGSPVKFIKNIKN